MMDNKNNPKCIHETVIRDIVNLVSGLGANADTVNKLTGKNHSFRNIAKASRDLTLTFPVEVSKDVPVEVGSMVAKAIERNAVAMLQMLFSAIAITDADDAIDYVKKFHTNLDTDGNMGIDDFIDITANAAAECAGIDITDQQLYTEVMKSFEKFRDHYLNEGVSSEGLDRFKVRYGGGKFYVNEALTNKDLKDAYRRGAAAGRADANRTSNSRAEKANRQFNDRMKEARAKHDAEVDSLKQSLDKAKNGFGAEKNVSTINKNNIDNAANQSFSTDVKKANELVPSMMVINFISVGDGKKNGIANCAVIGVKARLEYVESDDMLERIITKNADKNGLFNFLKATTGQISFWKDFVFAIDRAKLDSIANTKRGSSSPIWKLLEHRAIMSKIHRWTGTTNDASAITTLVISKVEADYLEKEERIRILNPHTAFTVMNAYNIMCFVVVDEALEKAHFLYDNGSNSYEVMSFNSLEREDGNGAYKKVINLLTKSR